MDLYHYDEEAEDACSEADDYSETDENVAAVTFFSQILLFLFT